MTDTQPRKSLFIKTYGCQMNVYDSERMAELLSPLGYRLCDEAEDADMVLLNTCHIREKASEKVYSELGRMNQLRQRRQSRQGRDMVIGVAGCVAQAENSEMQRRAPFVDIVVGPQAYHQLPELVARAHRRRQQTLNGEKTRGALATDFPPESKFDTLPPQRSPFNRFAPFLTIQEGCDKFCTFCVVPYTRGAEFSRPVAELVREARQLVAGGAREMTLLGQNVNAYHGEGEDGREWSLARLLYALADTGIERLRYTTSHPRDMDEALIAAHADIPALMPFLHLPVQSGSDRMLKVMNRQHTADEYRRIIDRLRSARPDMQFSSDFIVGYPGETEQDFTDTLRLVEEVTYAQAYSFIYSARPGTPASMKADNQPLDEKKQRLAALQDVLNRQQLAFNQRCVGQTLPVLFDRPGQKPGQWLGRTPFMQSAMLSEEEGAAAGRVLPVTIVKGFANSLQAVNTSIAAPETISGQAAA